MPYKDPEKARAYSRRSYHKHKEAKQATQKKWRIANRETLLIKKRAHYAAHAEENRARGRAWKQAHQEQVRALRKAYAAAHPEKNRAGLRRHYARHPEYYAARSKAYRLRSPHRVKAVNARYRARKAAAPIHDLTGAEWNAIKEHYDHRCIYCDRQMQRLTQDHMTPLSAGGSHTLWNVVPACGSCNSRKGTGPVLKPIQPLLLVATTSKTKAA